MLRRLKREVMAQLPPKRRQVVRLPPPLKHLWPPQPQSRNASGAFFVSRALCESHPLQTDLSSFCQRIQYVPAMSSDRCMPFSDWHVSENQLILVGVPNTGKEGSGEDDDEGADVVDNDMGAGVAAEQSEELSIGQRTGLAKLPNVLEWLKHALGSGGRRGGGGSSQAGGTQEAQPKFLVFAHHK